MVFLPHLTKPKAVGRPVEDPQFGDVSIGALFVYSRHANGLQNQLLAAGKKPLQMFKGKFKRAFMSQKKRPAIIQQCLDLNISKEVCSPPCIAGSDTCLIWGQQQDGEDGGAETANLVAPADDVSASHAEPLIIAELEEAQHTVKSDPGCTIVQEELPREALDIQTSELSASPIGENGEVTAGLPILCRVNSHPTFLLSEVQFCPSKGQGSQLNLDKPTSQLVSQHLEDTELFPSSPLATLPNTPSRSSSGAESRPDSGFGLSPTAEAQRWKRAYCAQQVAHRTMLRSLAQQSQDNTRVAEERLEEGKKTHASELSEKQEQLSTVISMHQALYAQHEELKAQKAESSVSSATKVAPKPVQPSDEVVLLKSRLEQSDRDLAKAKGANQALELKLTNIVHVSNVAAEEFAELQIAWQYEIGKNKQLLAQSDDKAVPGLAEYKSLYEKECMKNIQLRLAMEKDPKKTAEMDRTIDHLQKDLIQSHETNNQQVATSNKIEKQSKHEQTLAEAQLKAAASQNEMLADVAHKFCERKATFQSATNSLIVDLPECDNHSDIARAVDRYCNTVTYEKQLESLIEKGAARLTEVHGTIGRLEVQVHEKQTQIDDQRVKYETLDLKCKGHENKITAFEVEANHRAGDLAQITTAKDSKIQQLQSQLNQVETQLRSGLDACIQWFLTSKDQEIDTQKAQLTIANQENLNLKQELHTKNIFNEFDSEHRQNYLADLESYPPRLAAAEKEMDSLRARISTYESQTSATHENCVDLNTHAIRVSEVQIQTRAQITDAVRTEVGSQIKTETEQWVLRQWIQPLQELGSLLWARVVRLEVPLVNGGLEVRDRERWVLEEQSQRLRVAGWEGAGNAASSIGGMVRQEGQGQVVYQVQGRRQGPWNP